MKEHPIVVIRAMRLPIRSALVMIWLFLTPVLYAQVADTWEKIDLEQRSGFDSEDGQLNFLYINTLHIGFLGMGSSYITRNSGESWERYSTGIQFGSILPGGFGVAYGVVTYDSSQTWKEMPHDLGVIDRDGVVFLQAVAASSTQWVHHLIHQARYFDSTAKQYHQQPLYRLIYTTDGGTSWELLDTMVVVASKTATYATLSHHTAVGDFPVPGGYTDPRFGWHQVLAMPDKSTLVAVSFAQQVNGTTTTSRYYIGRIDLVSRSTQWTAVPTSDSSTPQVAMPVPGVFYSFDYRQERQPAGYYASVVKGIWRSYDWGVSWAYSPVPDWLFGSTTRFLSATHGVARNGYTFDGGQTWNRYDLPFWQWEDGNGGQMVAFDSLNYFFANQHSLSARSTDAGITWKRNAAGAPVYTVAAHGGRVLIGRAYQSLLLSDDYGDHWRDVGLEGRLWPDLSAVWGLDFPDTLNEPETIVGLAAFMSPDGERRVSIIKSTDSGEHWKEGSRLPFTDAPARLFFARSADGSRSRGFVLATHDLYASDDGGETWTHQYYFRDKYITMGDADNGVACVVDKAGGFWREYYTTDGGTSWQLAQPQPSNYYRPLGLAFLDGAGYRLIVAGYSSQGKTPFITYRSTNGGRTWDSLHTVVMTVDGGRVLWVDTTHVYLSTSIGEFRSTDGGGSFMKVDTGYFGGVTGRDDRFVYSASSGNYASRFSLRSQSSRVPDAAETAQRSNAAITYQNDEALLQYSLTSSSSISIGVYDMRGRSEIDYDLGRLNTGAHSLKLNTTGLPSGYYMLLIRTSTESIRLPLIVVH